MLRFYSYCFSALFVLFALLQRNDPDPVLWISIYLSAALLHLLSAQRRNLLVFTRLSLFLCIVAGIALWPDSYEGIGEEMRVDAPEIELARESLGLFVIALSLIPLSILPKRLRKSSDEQS